MDFQLCRSPSACVKILESWNTLNFAYGGLGMGLDFLFLSLYPLLLALGAIKVASSPRFAGHFFASVGIFAAWAQVATFLADLVETAIQAYLVVKFAEAQSAGTYVQSAYIATYGHLNELVYYAAVVKFAGFLVVFAFLLGALLLKLAGVTLGRSKKD